MSGTANNCQHSHRQCHNDQPLGIYFDAINPWTGNNRDKEQQATQATTHPSLQVGTPTDTLAELDDEQTR